MNILDVVHEEDYIRVFTDDNRGEYRYPVDKFNSLEQLEKEINKSAAQEQKRNLKRLAKFDKINKAMKEKYK